MFGSGWETWNSIPAYRKVAMSSEVPTQRVGFPGDPGGNARLPCGHVKAPLTDPTWPEPRQFTFHSPRSRSGRSRPKANSRGLIPNVEMGRGAAASAVNFQ